MRHASLVLSLAAMAPLAAADTEANNYWIRATVAAWSAGLGGDVAYADGGSVATGFGWDDVGLDDREVLPMAEVNIKIPLPIIPDIHVGFWSFATEGGGTLSQQIIFGDVTFNASDDVDTTAELTDLYGELSWRPLDLDVAGLAIGIGVHALAVDITLDNQTSGLSDSFEGTLPLPVLALRGHVNPLNSLGIEAVAHGLVLSTDEVEATFLDLRLQAVWRPLNMLGVTGGYRHVTLDLEVDDGEESGDLELTLSGPYLGVLAQF